MIKELLKKSLCFVSLLLFVLVVKAQDGDVSWSDLEQLDGYTIEFEPVHATCFNNGGLNLTIKRGGVPISVDEFNSLKISYMRIKYKATEQDTTPHTTSISQYEYPTTFVPMSSGSYEITFLCLVNTAPEGQYNPVQVDTTTTITVNMDYVNPDFAVLSSIDYDGVSLGNLPTLTCDTTGRMMVRIIDGRYPYHVTMVNNTTGEIFKDSTFNESQCYYVDELNRKYFRFMDVPAGDWKFYLTDGCGTSISPVVQKLDQITPPHLDKIYIYASSGTKTDDDVIKVDAKLKCQSNNSSFDHFPYYFEQYWPHLQYRFVVQGVVDNTPWKSFPPYEGSDVVTLFDTVNRTNIHYCDIWNKRIILQIRVDTTFGHCQPYTDAKQFIYYKPNEDFFTESHEEVIVDQSPEDGCNPVSTTYQKDFFSIRYKEYRPNNRNEGEDHLNYRYHFTYPIVWTYRDAITNTLIKTDTLWDISQNSTLSAHEVRVALNAANPNLDLGPTFTRRINRRLEDANHCVLLDQSQVLYDFELLPSSSSGPTWDVSSNQPYCRDQIRTIRLFERNSLTTVPNDGLTIELYESPESNRFNFKAIYHESPLQNGWIDSLEFNNTGTVVGGEGGHSLEFSGYGLPSGTYKFRVSGLPCGEDQYLEVYMRELRKAVLMEEPGFVEVQKCNEKYLILTNGRVGREKIYRLETDGYDSPERRDTIPQPTIFRLISGPVGGYDPMAKRTYHLGDTIRLSLSSDPEHPYVIQTTTTTSQSDMCGEFNYETPFHYAQPNLMPDVANGLMCSTQSDTGNVYVRAMNGIPPYTYQLYASYPPTGDYEEQITLEDPNEVAVFSVGQGLSIDSVMSCIVSDACPNNTRQFQIRFQSLADLQKVWFDNGMTVIEKCEGAFVQVHTLQAGAAFEYTWYRNGEFYTSTKEPEIFLERGIGPGVYRVEIRQTGCDSVITDSLTLNPKIAPWVVIQADETVCPGQEVPVTVTAHSALHKPVTAAVVIENRDGRETRIFTLDSEASETFTISVQSNTKIYPIDVYDEDCDYPFTGNNDTTRILIDDHIVNPCQILTQDAMVCYMRDATLRATVNSDLLPLTLTWCTDYSLTDTVHQEEITTASQWSEWTIPALDRRTYMYVAVEKDDYCPSSNLFAVGEMRMSDQEDVTPLACTSSYYFTDDGGADGDYSTIDGGGYQTHLFYTTQPGMPVTLHFDYVDLSVTSHLYIFSGSHATTDSLLYDFSTDSAIPDVLVSRSDTMLVYFVPGEEKASGWGAFVRPAPGIAVADIYPDNVTVLRDTVCQTHWQPYNDRHNFIQGPNSAELRQKLDEAVKLNGLYVFDRHETDRHGCDSTIMLGLLVTAPPYDKLDTVILSIDTFYWYGTQRTATGRYEEFHRLGGGDCDSVSILNLTVLNVKIYNDTICKGQDAELSIEVSSDIGYAFARPNVGDVLLSDGTIMRPQAFLAVKDSLLALDKIPIGVVYYLEPNDPRHLTGRAIAVFEAYTTNVEWSTKADVHSAHDYPGNYHLKALRDMEGYVNTQKMRETALNAGGGSFKENAPSAYYCWYYDPRIPGTGTEHKNWYLPSIGELNYVFAYRATINHTFLLLQECGLGETFVDMKVADSKYWSSTESGSNAAYCQSANGHVNNRNGKNSTGSNYSKNPRRVRAVIHFPLTSEQ